AASFSMWSASVRSATIRPPVWWMSVAKTCAPSAWSLFLTAAPIPLAAPVTNAFLPSSCIRGAVDVDRHAGEVRSVVAAKRDDECRRLGHGADPSHGDLLQRSLRARALCGHRLHLLQPAACDDARRDAVHAYPGAAKLERELARQAHDAGLGYRVRPARSLGARRDALARGDRRDVDHRPALLPQERRRRAAAVEDRVEIRGADRVPVLQRAIGEAAESAARPGAQIVFRDLPAPADAIHQHMKILQGREGAIDGGRVGDIALHATTTRKRRKALFVQIEDDDLHAFLLQPERHLVADALRLGGSGDDGRLHFTTRLRRMPMPSTSSSTTSPGLRKRICSRPQPLPTVPEPKNSPACRVSEREACAMQSSKVHFMSRELPRPHSSPLTRHTISSRYGSPISSAVT